MYGLCPTALSGVYELQPRIARDERGIFVKTIHANTFAQLGLRADFREEYYSVSHAGVLRGMHLQLPPHDHAKLVYCVTGRVVDVVVDLRRERPDYGTFVSFELSAESANMIYVPSGCAHGFCVLEGPATLVYHVTSEYEAEADAGIRWDSFGFAWPTQTPLVSPRDSALPALCEFASPFAI